MAARRLDRPASRRLSTVGLACCKQLFLQVSVLTLLFLPCSILPKRIAIQIPTISALTLESCMGGANEVVALTAEKHSVRAAAQFKHEPEIVSLNAIGATQRDNNLLPDCAALGVFHAG
jgi:hypothetical protein